MKRFLLLSFLAIAVVAGLGALNLYWFERQPCGARTVTVAIERGASLSAIVDRLHREGVVANPFLFRLYLFVKGKARRVRAGEYVFPPQLTPRDVAALLLKGDFKTYRLTLPEGWSLKEIGLYLAGLGFTTAEEFAQLARDPALLERLGIRSTSLEGYLFPSTYELYRPKNVEEVVVKLVDQFQRVFGAVFVQRAAELGLTVNQAVTLASLVEKETAVPEERPLVASVFHNRLKRGIPLATDPSVIYGLPNFDGNLRRIDLETPGPYNTYLNAGLPPTPIANPGEASLKAALWPAETDYLYFVARGDGTHQFSRSLDEHNAAVRKYQLSR